jgi:hypothetical protein
LLFRLRAELTMVKLGNLEVLSARAVLSLPTRKRYRAASACFRAARELEAAVLQKKLASIGDESTAMVRPEYEIPTIGCFAATTTTAQPR